MTHPLPSGARLVAAWVWLGVAVFAPAQAAAQSPSVYVSLDFASATDKFSEDQKKELTEFVVPSTVERCNAGQKPWRFRPETTPVANSARLVVSLEHVDGLGLYLGAVLKGPLGNTLCEAHDEVVPPGPRPRPAQIVELIKQIHMKALLDKLQTPMGSGLVADVPVGNIVLAASTTPITKVEEALALLVLDLDRFKDLVVEQFSVVGVCGDSSTQLKKFRVLRHPGEETRQVDNSERKCWKVSFTDYWDGAAWRTIDSAQLGCVNGFQVRFVYLVAAPQVVPPGPAGVDMPPALAPLPEQP